MAFTLLVLAAILLPEAPTRSRRHTTPLPGPALAAGRPVGRVALMPGGAAQRDIPAGEEHPFSLAVERGYYLRLAVTPSGIGLRTTVSDPDGRTLAQSVCRFDDPARLSWVAEVSGEYEIRVVTCGMGAAAGSYVLRAEGGPATPRERGRVAAELLILEAEKLRSEFSADTVPRYERALQLWREVGDAGAEAETLRDIGEVLRERGQRASALRYLEEALAASRRTKDLQKQGQILNDLGYLRALMGDYEQALSTCTRVLSRSRDDGDRRNEAQALSNIGWIHYDRGDLHKALEHQQAALGIWQELGMRRGEANSLLRIGYVNAILGETPEAFAAYERALELFRAVEGQRGQALVFAAVGHLHSMTGGKQEALDSYGRALAMSRPMEDSELTAQLASGMGYVHYELGDLDKALEYRSQALSLYQAMPDRWGEASLHLSVGRVYSTMGEDARALEHYRRGLDIARALANTSLESSLLKEVGVIYERQGRAREALSQYEKSLALSRSNEDPRNEVNALNHIGGLHAGRGRYGEALRYFARALPLARAINDRFSESSTLFNIARAQRDLGRMDEARERIDASVRLVESLRTNVASQNLRAAYFATVRRHYELYIDILMRLHERRPSEGLDALAFEVSERARARSLLETLAGSRGALRQGVDPALLRRERALAQQLSAKTERQIGLLAGPHKVEEAAAIARELDAITLEYETVEAEIRARSPHYAALTQPLGLGEIQARVLDAQTLLLEYALGDERSYVWAVTQTRVAGYELPGRAQIEEASRRLYGLLTAHQPVPGEPAAARLARLAQADADYGREADSLSDMILGPVAGHLAGRRLLLVADGALQYIPFGALATPVAVAPAGDRPPLFIRHEVVNLPSASILPALRGDAAGRTQVNTLVAVFADPVFERDDPRIADDTGREGEASAERAQLHRAFRDVNAPSAGGGIPRLLASREEADAIAGSLPPGEVEKFTGFAASRAAVTEQGLSRYRVIHFATHGILDSERPELSGIVLSLFDKSGQPEDGFLRLDDIYNLNLSADLVVLSACNTALGKDIKGEGLIGLTRGFMYAGAASVVASLWKVDDEATAELMRNFYQGLFERELAPAAALREAQLAMRRQKRWRAPYYWAGFVIQGQYGEIKGLGAGPSGGPRRLLAWGFGAAAISFALLYFAWLRQRRMRAARGPAGH